MTLRKIKAKKLGSTQQAWTGLGIKLSETFSSPTVVTQACASWLAPPWGAENRFRIEWRTVKKAHESSCISERASLFARLSWRLENWSSRKKSMLISQELKRHNCIRNIVLYWREFSTSQYFLIQQHFLFVVFILKQYSLYTYAFSILEIAASIFFYLTNSPIIMTTEQTNSLFR